MHTLVAADFAPGEPPTTLTEDEIHLWFFPQGALSDSGRSDQPSCLRDLLASYLRVEAGDLPIERDAHGKPFLAGWPGSATLQFNLAHSGNALLIGVSRSQALGVDLETGQRVRPWLALARRYFAAQESMLLSALSPARQAQAFLDLWSCKEAVLKAIGRGIGFGLHRLCFALDGEGDVMRLVDIDEEAGGAGDWQVLRVRPGVGMYAALAWRGSPRPVRAFFPLTAREDAFQHETPC